jgi:phosphate transport system substrate-binding protein
MGSDSEVNLVLSLSEAYYTHDSVTSIGIIGGGSGMGIASLINGKAHIANSSRPLTKSERLLCEERGVVLDTVVFARDAIAFIVHPSLPLDTISLQTIAALYKGSFLTWSSIGLPVKERIRLYGRQSNSGTYLYLRDSVLRGAPYAREVMGLNGNAQILEAVAQDRGGIGYVSVGYLGTAAESNSRYKVLTIVDGTGAGYHPTDSVCIASGTYPVMRSLFQFVSAKAPKAALKFIAFELSEEGQRIVAHNGYFPIQKAGLPTLKSTIDMETYTREHAKGD